MPLLPTDDADKLRKLLSRQHASRQLMSQTIGEQQRRLEQQEQRIAKFLRQFYGPRGERFIPTN